MYDKWHKTCNTCVRMHKLNTYLFFISLSFVFLGACRKSLPLNDHSSGSDEVVTDIRTIKVPEGFNWSTTKTYQISVSLKTPTDQAIAMAEISLAADTRSKNGKVIVKGLTNENGILVASVEVPSYFEKLILNTDQISIPQNILIRLTQPNISINLGGSKSDQFETVIENSYSTLGGSGKGDKDEGAEDEMEHDNDNPKSVSQIEESLKFISLSTNTWDSDGKPNYLEGNDNFSNDFLKQINEQFSGSTYDLNSSFFSPSCNRFITLNQDAAVYVSLVGESTDNQNALLYYTYDKNNPPASVNDISKLHVVFPNMSFVGSGGSLSSSNRVKIGDFKSGTTIAYCIATNGWKGGTVGYKGITKGKHLIYTNQDFNQESDDNIRQHVVSFVDESKKRFIMGFEDTRRDNGSDEDFDDAVICTTSIPSNAIDNSNSCVLAGGTDTDGDGISDAVDDFPLDETKAFINPSSAGSISFEDNWPYTGDYDMNDVVIDYLYNIVTNATNQVVRVEGTLTLRATGGAYGNGFGIQFPLTTNKVSGVTGATLEPGQSKAVLILFDNMRTQMNDWNTFANSAGDVKEFNIAFNVTNGPSLNAFGLGCYNPFIWNGSMGRGAEIHLPNYLPTDLVDNTLFGNAEDASNIASGSTYTSKENHLPWAIHTPEPFVYPIEKAPIVLGHKKFANWVKSGGTTYLDWYTNQDGYRDHKELHHKK